MKRKELDTCSTAKQKNLSNTDFNRKKFDHNEYATAEPPRQKKELALLRVCSSRIPFFSCPQLQALTTITRKQICFYVV